VLADEFFLMLYKELYFRHIYSKLTPTLEQRIASFANYRALFDYLWGACSCAARVCCSCVLLVSNLLSAPP